MAVREYALDKPTNYQSIEAAREAAGSLKQRPRPRAKSGFYGVSAHWKRWVANIFYGGEDHYLGIFDTKEEAALAYDKAAREHAPGRITNYDHGAAGD